MQLAAEALDENGLPGLQPGPVQGQRPRLAGNRSACRRGPLVRRGCRCRHVSNSPIAPTGRRSRRSEEHTSELQSLMRISYAVFCLKKKKHNKTEQHTRK